MIFHVTFGQRYPREQHPTLAGAHRDGWVDVSAGSYEQARAWAGREFEGAWSFMYADDADDWSPELFPLGCLATFEAS